MAKVQQLAVAQRLHAALGKIDRPGAFCATGTAPAILPGLEVNGLGPIGLPLTAKQAGELRERCEQAPYGKGEATLVDTDVRRVWRLTPDHFSLTNPAWTSALSEMLAKVQADLGLEQQRLEAHLYDLLLYEPGGFFLPHRDGEKLDRMVATLVVALPSAHEGGELIVRHEGQEQVVDFASNDGRYQIRYAAFYADCEHEVKPLHFGYRLCLIYNLTLAKSNRAVGAPRSTEHVARIADVLRDWPQGAEPPKLAVTLAHQYTDGGLDWDALKGLDRARAQVLAAAASQAGCQAHLALLTYWEQGSAEEDYYEPRGWRGRGRYREHSGPHKMGEVYDSSLTAKRWSSPSGERPRFGTIPVKPEEVVPPESLMAVVPKEDYEGYTGNEGMTLERWYRHAAVVLWPNKRHFEVLCAGGAWQAVPALAKMVSAWRKADGTESLAQRQRCLELARLILARWPEKPYPTWDLPDENAEKFNPIRPLVRLGDPELIGTYLREVLVKDVSLDPGRTMVRAVLDHGWATFRADLVALYQATSGESLQRNVRLLERLCLARLRGLGRKDEAAEALNTCASLAEATVGALQKVDSHRRDDWRMGRIDRAALLAHLGRALVAVDQDDLLAQVVAHCLRLPKQYPLGRVHMPALTKLGAWAKDRQRPSRALLQWIATCRQELETRTAAAPRPPADFRRAATVECDCPDCAELNRFLSDPRQEQRGFQMPQHRRTHLEESIGTYNCDLNCKTDKRPRPQILVCTKNTASHERDLKEYRENLEHLASLRLLEKELAAIGPQPAAIVGPKAARKKAAGKQVTPPQVATRSARNKNPR